MNLLKIISEHKCAAGSTLDIILQLVQSPHTRRKKRALPVRTIMHWGGQCTDRMAVHSLIIPCGHTQQPGSSTACQKCKSRSTPVLLNQIFIFTSSPGDVHAGAVWEAAVCSSPFMSSAVGSSEGCTLGGAAGRSCSSAFYCCMCGPSKIPNLSQGQLPLV